MDAMVMDHAQGQKSSKEPMGLSILVSRRYGFAEDAHFGRSLSRILGDAGVGAGVRGSINSDAMVVCGVDDLTAFVWVGFDGICWRDVRVGSGRRRYEVNDIDRTELGNVLDK